MIRIPNDNESAGFEKQYLSLRRKEGRIYDDHELKQLPHVPRQHPLSAEWKIRASSCRKLLAYIQQQKRERQILEMGCGNGWLSHMLSTVKNVTVTAADINRAELEQARRVFADTNIQFIQAGMGDQFFRNKSYDLVIFASSIQYFPSATKVLKNAMSLLKPSGEIHIIDSHFYTSGKKAEAQLRSREYFEWAGAPLMQNYYYHHCLEDLSVLNYEVLNRFSSLFQKMRGRKSFPWIRIKKQVC